MIATSNRTEKLKLELLHLADNVGRQEVEDTIYENLQYLIEFARFFLPISGTELTKALVHAQNEAEELINKRDESRE